MPHFVWLTERLPGGGRGEGRTEAEEKALNGSLGIHKFLPSLLSSCVPSLALSVRLDAKIAPLLGRAGLKMLHERTKTELR